MQTNLMQCAAYGLSTDRLTPPKKTKNTSRRKNVYFFAKYKKIAQLQCKFNTSEHQSEKEQNCVDDMRAWEDKQGAGLAKVCETRIKSFFYCKLLEIFKTLFSFCVIICIYTLKTKKVCFLFHCGQLDCSSWPNKLLYDPDLMTPQETKGLIMQV